MKKLLSMLAVSTLSTTILPTTNLILNTKVNNNIYSKLNSRQTFIVNIKGIIKWQSVSKTGKFIWLAKKDVVGENNVPDFFWDAGLGSSISVGDDSIWEKIGVVYGFSKLASDNEINKLMNSKPVINATITIEKNNNNLSLKDFSAKYSPVDISETIPKNYYLNTNTKTFVYNKKQLISINEKFIKSATFDTKKITIPTTDLDLTNGQHTLVLTLKDEYKQSAILFGGNQKTGEITFNFWIKTSIDKKDIKYSTNHDDTDLTDLSLGFVSTSGNTINCPIIQTKSKDGSVHNAPLITKFNDVEIDYPNSYYVQGTVDKSTNNFTATGSKQILSPTTTITTDGTYHLHLVDTVGNTYDSYLELGESNWKLKGTFNDTELNQLKTKLNVKIDLTDPQQLARATGWLKKYEQIVSDLFEKSLKANGKGFDSEIRNELENDFKWFLKPLTYDIANEPKFTDGIEKDLLVKTITYKAKEIKNKSLDLLPKNLHVRTSNVVNKSTLEHYTNWINNYQDFINKNKDKWINDIEKIASRGFATKEQENQISSHILSLDFEKYLEEIIWEDNSLLKASSNDYQQYIKLEQLKSDTIYWVNTNIKDINTAYKNAITQAESGLNLHGYSIDTLLNGKKIPQTKSEIENFADGQSFHNWLQSQANIKFHGWQLTMGLGIGIPLFLLTAGIGFFIYWGFNKKYNPYNSKNKKKE